MPIACQWMGLNLPSPIILASITLFSHVNLNQHINYYKKCSEYGAGAIILPSVNPSRSDAFYSENRIKIRTKIIDSGFDGPMGFTLLGPTNPNLISVGYGVALAKGLLSSNINASVIASVANIGTLSQIEHAIGELAQTPIDGLELNLSCPNALTEFEQDPDNNYFSIVKSARKICDRLPISLKLSPMLDYGKLLEIITDEVQSLTLVNAYVGLMPPNPSNPTVSPFEGYTSWAPTGIYGPQQRMLTYYHLHKIGAIAREKKMDISCVGGFVNAKQVVQAFLLGATTVQLSSVIAWKGIQSFMEFNEFLNEYLLQYNISDMQNLIGISLPYIKKSADQANENDKPHRCMTVTKKCKKCKKCICTDKLCLAIYQSKPRITPEISSDLCSGCGWCKSICPHKAIAIRE